jgi:hypothetical protein
MRTPGLRCTSTVAGGARSCRAVGRGWVDILIYRKATRREPDEAFTEHTLLDDRGGCRYGAAERQVTLTYTTTGEREFVCRQVTRKSANGHQIRVLTTPADLAPSRSPT